MKQKEQTKPLMFDLSLSACVSACLRLITSQPQLHPPAGAQPLAAPAAPETAPETCTGHALNIKSAHSKSSTAYLHKGIIALNCVMKLLQERRLQAIGQRTHAAAQAQVRKLAVAAC